MFCSLLGLPEFLVASGLVSASGGVGSRNHGLLKETLLRDETQRKPAMLPTLLLLPFPVPGSQVMCRGTRPSTLRVRAESAATWVPLPGARLLGACLLD
ncbi:hypothetical protein NDU88_005185 [Pleurodeles waltl]|uniref:Secreted protein n=1 Tax=Pleurodeles waltl TaxID=8319 RepID=A0AAV7M8J4_PLEWA|nr:hypothetical protein NDU88_005185 [Pleurodeles waltl]